MAFLDDLRRGASSLGDLLLGQDPSKVRLSPEREALAEEQRRLRERGFGRALGEVPLGEVSAAEGAGRRAIGDIEAAEQSRVATARTPAAKLAAERGRGARETRARTDIAGQVARTAQQAEAQALRDAQASAAAGMTQEQLLEEERKKKARPGGLPVVGAALGSLFGPAGGALGGSLGSAFTRR